MDNIMPILMMSGIGFIALLIIGFIVATMFVKASSEMSFVRTGFGGKKVIKEGGAVVLPVVQIVTWVRLSTLKLQVEKSNQEALITKDRMRVDITAEFYMRVKPEEESIAMAAQTLGDRTQNPAKLKELMEGKFVDVLRSVAMEMEMAELFEKRSDFVQKVQNNIREDLTKNGLELETVSLTGLDQTSKEHFNEDNAMDAEGLTKLTKIIEERKKERNDIEKENSVLIEQKNLETEKKKLEIAKEKKFASLEQERDIVNRTETENAAKAKIEAEQAKLANDAKVESEKEIKTAQIVAGKILEEENIKKAQAVEAATIEKEQVIQTATIQQQKAIEAAKIEKEKTIELANQQRDIEVAEKSKEKSEADKEASEALSQAVAAEEKVTTARETEIAERQKAITIIKAEEESGYESAKVKVIAQADKEAAEDRAEAIKIEAQAKADAVTIQADADERKYEVDAEGQEKLNEAENKLSEQIISMRIKLETVTHLTAMIEASVKPLEKIDAFKVFNVSGLTNGNGGKETGNTGGGYATNLVDELLKFRAQSPVIDNIIKELGLGSNLSDVIQKAAGVPEKKKEISQVSVESSEKDPDNLKKHFEVS